MLLRVEKGLWETAMLRYLSTFVLSFLCATALTAEPRMLDRLIVEINGKSFSQRQIEIYHALRTIVAGGGPRKALLDESSWKEAVESFKNEMLVYANIEGDQQRMDSFQADKTALQQAEREIQRLQLDDKPLLDRFKRLGLTEAEIQRNLLIIFRIQAYVRSRVQVLNPELETKGLLDVDSKADWFTSLLRSTTFRFYDSAKDYVLLQARKKDET